MTYTDRLTGTRHTTPLVSKGRTEHITESGMHYLRTLATFNLQADIILQTLHGTDAANALRHDIAALTTHGNRMYGLELHLNSAAKQHSARESVLEFLHRDIPQKYARLADATSEFQRLNAMQALSTVQSDALSHRLGIMEKYLNESAAHIPALARQGL